RPSPVRGGPAAPARNARTPKLAHQVSSSQLRPELRALQSGSRGQGQEDGPGTANSSAEAPPALATSLVTVLSGSAAPAAYGHSTLSDFWSTLGYRPLDILAESGT